MYNIKELEDKAKVIRRHIINSIYSAGSGHPGGSLSCTDILVALYFNVMKHGDRFMLSKGHAAPALYAILAECGHFSVTELKNLRKNDAYLQGHPDCNISGVEVSSGSLGQGLSIANGMALASKLDKLNNRIFVIMGDGECDEGQVWEAAMTSTHHKLDNLVAIVDRNRLQVDGKTEDVVSLEPFRQKWEAFGWNVTEANGHNIKELIDVLNQKVEGKPHMIIANTIKGKGVSFMENNLAFHGKSPSKEEFANSMEELK